MSAAPPTSHRHSAILPSGRRIHLVLPLSSGPKVEPRRDRQDRRRPRQTAASLSLGSIRAIAVHPALAADDDDDDDHATEHATLAAARRAALRRAGHAHRKAAAAGRETLARVVVLALAFFFVVIVFALASVFVPTVGDAADARAAVWWWRSAGHRRACGRGDLGTDRGVPHHAQEGGWRFL